MGVIYGVIRTVSGSPASPMRAGLVIYGPLGPGSGEYLYDRKLVEHLEARGDDVIVFQQPKRSYPLRPVQNVNVLFWRRLASADLDVLLQDEFNHGSLALGNHWLRRRIDVPIVAIVHSTSRSSGKLRPHTTALHRRGPRRVAAWRRFWIELPMTPLTHPPPFRDRAGHL